MAIFRCKMCGGALEFENETTAFCGYCGTRQTLPKISDERRASMYERANNLRLNNEFDKAMGIYEQIVSEDPTDAESYWSLVLCRFGIEYVEDPKTEKRVPTVNRAQRTSIFDDVNYKSAIANADVYQRMIYEDEAAAINEIQKGILSISDKEEPFDIFICYKDSDLNGERTPDSLIAEDIYSKLTKEGFKVFYSRITLEDKLGTAYEPYIFAALNSAKVMLVVGTREEYFNAVWVKNEWSRYLALIRDGADKILIPVYRDINPHALPEEFSHLQAQDAGKIAFMQDLIRGIKKIITPPEEIHGTSEEHHSHSGANINVLIKRAFMSLEDKEFTKADAFCEQILNENPENTSAYLVKLLADLKISSLDEINKVTVSFEENGNYKKLMRFADSSLKDQLGNALKRIASRQGEIRTEQAYTAAKNAMNSARTEAQFRAAADMFSKLPAYKDSDSLAIMCRSKAKTAHDQQIYSNAVTRMRSNTVFDLETAMQLFESIPDHADSKAKASQCRDMINTIRKNEKKAQKTVYTPAPAKKKKKKHRFLRFLVFFGIFGLIVSIIMNLTAVPSSNYDKAVQYLDEKRYEEALGLLVELNDYKDSEELLRQLWDDVALRDTVEAGGAHTLAITEDGEVLAIGDNSSEQCDTGSFRNIIDISAGQHHTVTVNRDGMIRATGPNLYGECDVSQWFTKTIVDVSAGYNFTVALVNDGSVVATGNNDCGQLNTEAWENIRAVSAGAVHTVGLRFNGTVVATGDNAYGQCDVSDWKDIVAISAGRFHTVGLKADGTVVAVGRTTNDEHIEVNQCAVSEWTDIIAVAAGDYHTVGLKADGTVVCVGDNTYRQINTDSWTDIVAVSAGSYHTVALKEDGTVICAGVGGSGQCNTQDWQSIAKPKS